MSRPTHVYVVLSPRPRVGKTLMARVFTEFYRSEGRPVAAYDLDPTEAALSEFLPGFAVASQIADTRGQMALFDRLIVDDEKPKVVDVGTAVFSHFLTVMTEIDFVPEARRRSVEPIIVYVEGVELAPFGEPVEGQGHWHGGPDLVEGYCVATTPFCEGVADRADTDNVHYEGGNIGGGTRKLFVELVDNLHQPLGADDSVEVTLIDGDGSCGP